jgi:hypothetical protein
MNLDAPIDETLAETQAVELPKAMNLIGSSPLNRTIL